MSMLLVLGNEREREKQRFVNMTGGIYLVGCAQKSGERGGGREIFFDLVNF